MPASRPNANGRWPDYTDRARDVRVRQYLPWFQSLLFVPEPGDANRDARVDLYDYNFLSVNYLRSGSDVTWSEGDFTGDHRVDMRDYNWLSVNFGHTQSVVGASGASVPEPSVVCLLAAALALLSRRRK